MRILGKEGLCDLGFNRPRGKLMALQPVMLNRVEKELPSASYIAKADDIELQEIREIAARSTEDLITQLNDPPGDSLQHPLCELLGLDKELRSIRGSLTVEIVKKVQSEECIEREKHKLFEIRDNPEYDDGIQEDIRNRTERLNDDLKVRQESTDLLKGRLTNQITGLKETISKVWYKDTSLAEKIWTLSKEEGIAIASILMVVGMAISVLVKALLPGSGGEAAQGKGGGNDKPENVKEWLKNKLKALASLLERLGMKVAEALPGIIGKSSSGS